MQFRSSTFYELAPARGAGPQITVAADGWKATRHYIVQGDPVVIAQAISDFLGGPSVKSRTGIDGQTYNYVSRQLPHSFPGYFRASTELAIMWAATAAVLENYTLLGTETVLGGDQLPNYRFAKIDVQYVGYRFAVRGDGDPAVINPATGVTDEGTLARYVSVFRKPNNRVLTFPRQLLRWCRVDANDPGAADKGAIPITEGIPIPEPGQVITVLWHQVPVKAFPTVKLGTIVGSVNATTFLNCDPGTLLFDSPDSTPIVLANGEPGLDVTYTLRRLPRALRQDISNPLPGLFQPGVPNPVRAGTQVGWNWYPRNLKGSWDYRPISSSGQPTGIFPLQGNGAATGTSPLPATEFRDAFRPDNPLPVDPAF